MKSVLVTGGNGFIASHLIKKLLDEKQRVIAVDIHPKPGKLLRTLRSENLDNLKYVQADISRDLSVIDSLVSSCGLVYHFAALVGIPNYLQKPSELFNVNVVGSKVIIESCIKHEKRILFASTSEIYGKNPTVPWHEDADRILGSTSVNRWNYSSSKATIEHLLFANEGILDFRIVRYFNIYGPGQNPIFLVSRSIHRAINNTEILLYDGGDQTRCLTYIDDAILATQIIAEADVINWRVYNVGSKRESTVQEVITIIQEKIPGTKIAKFNAVQSFGGFYEDLARRVPDVSRIRNEFGWQMLTEMEIGLERSIEWAKHVSWWRDLKVT